MSMASRLLVVTVILDCFTEIHLLAMCVSGKIPKAFQLDGMVTLGITDETCVIVRIFLLQ